MIEVERRARFSARQKAAIMARVQVLAGVCDLGTNDAQTIFYLSDARQVKVQHALSKGTAKIAYKSGGNTGESTRQEIEVAIDPSQIDNACTLVEALTPDAKRFVTAQRRHDYALPNDIIISIKYSDDWGDHLEIDSNLPDGSDTTAVLHQIDLIAEQLGVTLLTPAAEKAFVAQRIAKLEGQQNQD